MKKRIIKFFLGSILLTGCVIPQHLQKYQKDNTSTSTLFTRQSSNVSNETNPFSFNKSNSLVIIDECTYRFNVSEKNIWESTIKVLIQNYNITTIDRSSGIITTEWDTVYLNDGVYRNKLSIKVSRVSLNVTEVSIHNNVEKLQNGNVIGGIGLIWLPTKDKTNEVRRIIKNIANVLGVAVPANMASLAINKNLKE